MALASTAPFSLTREDPRLLLSNFRRQGFFRPVVSAIPRQKGPELANSRERLLAALRFNRGTLKRTQMSVPPPRYAASLPAPDGRTVFLQHGDRFTEPQVR